VIERICWTSHALERVDQRGLVREEVEAVLRQDHTMRALNRGEADWRLHGATRAGRRFAVIYDQPVLGDRAAARIVSVWVVRDRVQP
jgi:hypothetical protein